MKSSIHGKISIISFVLVTASIFVAAFASKIKNVKEVDFLGSLTFRSAIPNSGIESSLTCDPDTNNQTENCNVTILSNTTLPFDASSFTEDEEDNTTEERKYV